MRHADGLNPRLAGDRDPAKPYLPCALAASLALLAGVFLAFHHPLSPWFALTAFLVWTTVAARFAGLWLVVLPASLPASSLAPWTGWIVFEEFDLLVLGALAGGFMRLAVLPAAVRGGAFAFMSGKAVALSLLCFAATAVALVRGLATPGDATFDWHQGHADPLNAVRVGKAMIYAVLLLPLLDQQARLDSARTMQRFARGMLIGLGVVVAAVLWERAAFPGLLDVSSAYRTVALFWEMHVGGAAIDAYLAMAVPFAAWAVVSARTPLRWCSAAGFAVLVQYACLTTFSRGVYLAVAVALAVFALCAHRSGAFGSTVPWQRRAGAALLVVLLMQAAAVFGSDAFMLARVKRSTQDFANRLAHWQHGLGLLQGPVERSFGLGLGRLPATYAGGVVEREFSGSARVVSIDGERHLSLSGPERTEELAGLHALTQRIAGGGTPGAYGVYLDARSARETNVELSVCEVHLLYEARCQTGVARVAPTGGEWRPVEVALSGPPFGTVRWPPPPRVFSVKVLDVGASVDIDNLALRDAGGASLLANGDFTHRLARWFPVARLYFVPWHIDNLYLEILIEQGIVGLAIFAALYSTALACLMSSRNRDWIVTGRLLPALAGGLTLGMVSSLADAPRVAFLLYFMGFMALELADAPHSSKRLAAQQTGA